MTKQIEAIEMKETRTIQGKQRVRGKVLVVGEDITHANAVYYINRNEAKEVSLSVDEAGAEAEDEPKTPAAKKTAAKKPVAK